MALDKATPSIWETLMRFTPASILLAGALALSASGGIGKKAPEPVVSPAATAWIARASAALQSGDISNARASYETALLLSPGDPAIYYALGRIARAQKLPGKAIKYFSDALRLDPANQLALQGQGLAMMEKGATQSARDTLAKLKTLCKTNCAAAEPLASAIAAGPPKFVSADATPTDKTPPVQKR